MGYNSKYKGRFNKNGEPLCECDVVDGKYYYVSDGVPFERTRGCMFRAKYIINTKNQLGYTSTFYACGIHKNEMKRLSELVGFSIKIGAMAESGIAPDC